MNTKILCLISDFVCRPVVVLPSAGQMAIAVRFCPILFKLRGSYSQTNSDEKENELQQEQKQQRPASLLFNLPYRMILAVATNTSVTFYDTEQSEPFAMISNMHYTRLTDLTWYIINLLFIFFPTLFTFSS